MRGKPRELQRPHPEFFEYLKPHQQLLCSRLLLPWERSSPYGFKSKGVGHHYSCPQEGPWESILSKHGSGTEARTAWPLSRCACHREAENRKCKRRDQRKGVSTSCVLKPILSTHDCQKDVGRAVLVWREEVQDCLTTALISDSLSVHFTLSTNWPCCKFSLCLTLRESKLSCEHTASYFVRGWSK